MKLDIVKFITFINNGREAIIVHHEIIFMRYHILDEIAIEPRNEIRV